MRSGRVRACLAQTVVVDLIVAFAPSTLTEENSPMRRSTRRYGRSAGTAPTSPTPSARSVQPPSSPTSSIRSRCEPPSTALARSSDTARARSSTCSAGTPRSLATAVTNARRVTPMRGSVGTSTAAPLIPRPSAEVVDGQHTGDRGLEPGQAEELRHRGRVGRDEHQLASELSNMLEARDDRTESARVHETDRGEVQSDLRCSVRGHLPNALAECGRGRKVELAGNREDRPRPHRATLDHEFDTNLPLVDRQRGPRRTPT